MSSMSTFRKAKMKWLCRSCLCVLSIRDRFGHFVCMGFMTLITAMVLCARSQVSLLSVSKIRVPYALLGLRAEESLVLRHVEPPRYGEASIKPRARSWDRTEAIGALANRFTNWAARAPWREKCVIAVEKSGEVYLKLFQTPTAPREIRDCRPRESSWIFGIRLASSDEKSAREKN